MLKRNLGIAAVAALGALSLSQVASAESYDFWLANTPKQAEAAPAPSHAARVDTSSAFEEYNEVTAVAPKRADAGVTPSKPKSPRQVLSRALSSEDALYYGHTGGIAPM